MEELQGVIQAKEPRKVNTQYGPKDTVNFVIGGDTFSGGFKKWDNVNVGDEVFVTFQTTPQGYRNIKGLTVVAAGSGGPVPQINTAPKRSGGGSRTFPVEPLAPERTINRQNALTAAVNFHVHQVDGTTKEEVVETARYFEAYTTGDLDLAEAKALAGAE